MPRKTAPPLPRAAYSLAEIAVMFGVDKDTAALMARQGWFGDPATFLTTPGGGKKLIPAGPVEDAAARYRAGPSTAAAS